MAHGHTGRDTAAVHGAAAQPEDPEGAVEARLAWIFGSARTGSSWLLRMLVHPWALAANEVGVRPPRGLRRAGGPPIVPVNESHLPLHLTPHKFPRYEEELNPGPPAFVANTKRRGNAHYFFNEQYADVWRPHARSLAIARFRAQAARIEATDGISGAPIVIKEPNGSHGAKLVMELLPRAKLIFLMRDGRDVVDSQLALRVPGGARSTSTRQQPVVGHEDRLREVLRNSRLWVNNMQAVLSAYEAHRPELRYRLRYEDLRRDPRRELSELRRWLGVPGEDAAVAAAVEAEAFERLPERKTGAGTGKRVAQPGHWRKTLTPVEQGVAEGVMAETLELLGYEV